MYGKCGNACEICNKYVVTCRGCLAENAENSETINCLFYNCAFKKNVKSCLSCAEYPCRLTRGVSRAYCPIHSIESDYSPLNTDLPQG